MIKTFSSVTRDGIIKHRRHPVGFDMPVRLVFDDEARVRDMKELQAPARSERGGYLFVMPGGFNYVEK